MSDQSAPKAESAAAWQGMRARMNGKSADACPYDPGPLRTAWIIGWYIAEPGNTSNE